jgi:hypothetical protein
MSEMAPDLPRRPRPEDFGLTEELVRAAPRSLFGARRGAWVVGIYGVAALAVLAALLVLSGSPAASVALTVVIVAAASVLLVPAIIGLVCALELGERSWLCRRDEQYPAIESYRRAIDGYEVACRHHAAARARVGERFWRDLSPAALVDEVVRVFESSGVRVERLSADRETGFDLVLREAGGPVAVRCEAGGVAAGRSLGREMEGARSDLGVERMILVSPHGATDDLRGYLEDHGGSLLDAAELDRLRAAVVS